MAKKSKEFITKDAFKVKFRKIRHELDDLKIYLDEVRGLIKTEVDSSINHHINEMIEAQIKEAIDGIYERVDNKILKGYLNECENIAATMIRSAIEKNISWEYKTVKMNKMSHADSIEKMYNDGFHIAFAGELKDGGDKIIIFEKPNKVIVKKLSSKSKKKKRSKIKRTPL